MPMVCGILVMLLVMAQAVTIEPLGTDGPDVRRTLQEALTHADVTQRVLAVRSLGRLEDEGLIPRIGAALDDPSLEVRIEAAHALAQSATSSTAADEAFRRLYSRLAVETDGGVIGALATSVGRLPFGSSRARGDAVQALERLLSPEGPVRRPSVFTLVGVARGAASLARGCARDGVMCDTLAPLLERLVRTGRASESAGPRVAPVIAARVRRLAASGRAALGPLTPAVRQDLLADADAEVRRIGIRALAADPETTETTTAVWLDDVSMLVRHAVVQHGAARWPSLARRALDDPNPHVRLAAIDALGEGRACDTRCAEIVRNEKFGPDAWHPYAHALVALARTDADAVVSVLPTAMRHDTWQVRMYAARAAAEAGNVPALRLLARDAHPNVREAALTGLAARDVRDADDVRLEALTSDDYQLVLTAARTLEGTLRRGEAQNALLAALRRLTDDRRHTSRDPRLMLIERLDEVGDASLAEALRPWLKDDDPVVAERVARLVETRTGTRPTAALRPLPRVPVPSADEIARLEAQQVVLTIRGLGDVTIGLAPREAPSNAARFAAQVVAGAWDGLTFHRVEPGFVVQGGSPGANEYVGADRFTYDERSHLSHVRGSVGISTRGRHTGDGQIFINLVDNARLDHAYTVIGTVVAGLSHVDAMLEGAVIERARLVGP